MDVDPELPDEGTEDGGPDGLAASLTDGPRGFIVTRAEPPIDHAITGIPDDQTRRGDFENAAAIGRLPADDVVEAPDDATNALRVSGGDSHSGDFLPSCVLPEETGDLDLDPAVTETPICHPDGRLVGYRATVGDGNLVGSAMRDVSPIDGADAADLGPRPRTGPRGSRSTG